MSEMSGADYAVVEALREVANFIKATSGIGNIGTTYSDGYSDGWYAAVDYAVSELRARASFLEAKVAE